jgi:hypothetical protein
MFLVLLIPKYIQVYTAAIEGMLKVRKYIQNSINFTIPNGAFVQAAIKQGSKK